MEIILRVPDWLITVSEKFVNTFFTKENLWHLLVALLLYVAFISVLWCMDRLMESMENRILILGLGPPVTLLTIEILAILGVPACCLLSLMLLVGFNYTLWCVRIVKRLWRYFDNLEQNGKAEEKPEKLETEIRNNQELPPCKKALVQMAMPPIVGSIFLIWLMVRLWRYLGNRQQNGKAEEKPEEELKIEICSQDLPTYEEALVSAQGAAYEEKKINVFIVTMPEETK